MSCSREGKLSNGFSLPAGGDPVAGLLSLYNSGALPCVTLPLSSLPTGVRTLVAVAGRHRDSDKFVINGLVRYSMPCGKCLQVMADCCPIGEDIQVYVMGMDGRGVRLTRFSHLLTMPYVSSRRQAAMAAAITTNSSTDLSWPGFTTTNGVLENGGRTNHDDDEGGTGG